MPFDISTAVQVNDSEGQVKNSGNFDISTAHQVDVGDGGKTPYENFRTPNNVNPTGITVKSPEREDEGFLNGVLHSAEGAAWNVIAKPLSGVLGKPISPEQSKDMDSYLSDIDKKHPIASVIGGTIPYIATAPLVPESLLGVSAQFGGLAGLSAIGKARIDDSSKPIGGKLLDITKETAEGASFGPIWHYSKPLGWMAKAFVRGAGTGTLTGIYGNDISEAFKQGGTIGALSLIFENPILAKTAIGRGVINKVNQYEKEPISNPDTASHQEIRQTVLKASENMSQKVFDKPKIVSATIKLPDGTQIHGTSHEDALSKIGENKDTMKERDIPNVSLKPGLDNRGSTNFIYNEEGKKVGDINYKNMQEEGIDISIDEQRKGYGTSAIKKVFDSGENTIYGDVGKSNFQAQNFWKSIGGRLTETDSGNFKLYLTKENFNKNTFQAGFTVQHSDGHTEFINREESKQAPYNLKDGRSQDVKGLNQQKYLTPPEQPKSINNEEGKLDINLVPGVAETSELLQRSSKELTETFTPPRVGEESKIAAENLREQTGQFARSNDKLEASLKKTKDLFDKATKESSLDFMYKWDEGKPQESSELQKINDVLQKIDTNDWDDLLKTGKVNAEDFITNHMPRYWNRPNQMINQIKRIFSKRPFEGGKSFAKQRVFTTMREGVDAGYEPLSYNPVDFVMWRHREVQKFIAAFNTKESLKSNNLRVFVRTGEEKPKGWVKIDDRAEDVHYKNDKGELVVAGSYYTQPDAARIINNYLSPGLRGNYFYDMYRGGGNVMNQFQLGISAFHLGFTSMDATVSKFALGINKLSRGDVSGAGKEFIKAPFSPITNIIEGQKLLEAWNGKDKGEITNTIADYMASAGGRAGMDSFYKTKALESMQKSFKEGKVLTGVLKIPFSIIDKMSSPIMEYIVPRQKMGVFSDLMRMELENNPGASHEELRSMAQKAWDSVDNRMGQLVYDNLFWNKTVKDLSMASVRSLGWNLGTVRELGGGLKDIKDIGKSGLSYRTAYVMALPLVAGLYGAIYQYLHTGKGPQELRDYYFPKNGNIDNKGNESRVSLPTYMKDVYHYATNPVQTVLNKFSPVNDAVLQMLANKDFYGTEIRNVDDPVMQQVFDELKFVGKQFEPFSFSNLGKDTGKGISSKVEPFIGITPAPYDINMTKAEKAAYELFKSNVPSGSHTKEEAQVSETRSKLKSEYFASGDQSKLKDAVKNGDITKKEMNEIIKQKGMSNLERFTEHLSVQQTMSLMNKTNEKEKEDLEKIIKKKRINAERIGTWTDKMEKKYEEMISNG